MQSEFPEDKAIAYVLPLFYRKYNLGEDGGLNDTTVKIVFYKNIYCYIPNIDARRKAVLKHDIHHLVTGYKSDYKGETEISAWEVASGCKKYWAALALDLSGMASGFFFNMPGVFRAFIRGRRTKNLYNDAIPDQQLLTMTINEIRNKLGLDTDVQGSATLGELMSFIAMGVISSVFFILSGLLLPVLIIYSIIIGIREKKQGAYQ